MSLYSLCSVPVVVRVILKLLLGDRAWLVVSNLSWIVFHYCVKYFVFIKGASPSARNKWPFLYNLHCKQKNWITTLALVGETAKPYLPTHEQKFVRQQVTRNLDNLFKNNQNKNNYQTKASKRKKHCNKTNQRTTEQQ